jgi:hypothetical protein
MSVHFYRVGGGCVPFLLVEVWLFIAWLVSVEARPLLSILGFVLQFFTCHTVFSGLLIPYVYCYVITVPCPFIIGNRSFVGKLYRKKTAVWVPVAGFILDSCLSWSTYCFLICIQPF